MCLMYSILDRFSWNILQGINNASSVSEMPRAFGGASWWLNGLTLPGDKRNMYWGPGVSWVQMAIVNITIMIAFPHCSVCLVADPLSTRWRNPHLSQFCGRHFVLVPYHAIHNGLNLSICLWSSLFHSSPWCWTDYWNLMASWWT